MKAAHQYTKAVLMGNGLSYADNFAYALRLVAVNGDEAVNVATAKWTGADLVKRQRRQRRKQRPQVVVRTQSPIQSFDNFYQEQLTKSKKTRCLYGTSTYGTGIYSKQDKWR